MGDFNQHRRIAESKPVTDDYGKAHAAALAAGVSIARGTPQVPETTRRPSWLLLSSRIYGFSVRARDPRVPNIRAKAYLLRAYYVSQALLQSRKTEAASIARVSAPDVEALVCKAVREALRTDQETVQTDNDVRDPEMIGCSPIRAQVICDELVWDKAIFLQKLAHQFERRSLVPPGLDQQASRRCRRR
jgi:hypothetical protein